MAVSRVGIASIVMFVLVVSGTCADFLSTLQFAGVGGQDMAFPSQDLTTLNTGSKVTVTVQSALETVDICVQQYAGAHPPLETNCGGAFVRAHNKTNKMEAVELARKSYNSFATNKRFASRFVGSARYELEAADPTSYSISLAPNTRYSVTVFSSDNRTAGELVSVTFSAVLCEDGEMGTVDGTCVTPIQLIAQDTTNYTIASKATQYFAFPAGDDWSDVSFSTTEKDFDVWFRPAALPDKDNMYTFPETNTQDNGDDKHFQLVGTARNQAQWFIAVTNNYKKDLLFDVATATHQCDAGFFGWNCSVPVANITEVPTSNTTAAHMQAGVVGTFSYLQVINSGNLPAGANVVRFSVVSDVGQKSASVYARWGAPPTLANYDIVADRNYVNQLLLPVGGIPNRESIDGFEARWYTGVWNNGEGFTYWVGLNCQKCADGATCLCAGGLNNTCDGNASYFMARAGEDSYGACPCTDKKKNNFDCSAEIADSKGSHLSSVYVLLIALAGAVVLVFAVGAPVFVYLRKQKNDSYERI